MSPSLSKSRVAVKIP